MLKEWRRMLAAGLLRGPQLAFFAPRKPEEELYDTERDPHEIENLAERPTVRPRLAGFRAELER